MFKTLSILLIKLYRLLFAWKPPICRFTPSCSNYALEAINKYGFFQGWKLAIKRILSCHPFSSGGDDPVP
ncbi:MAG: membrane protein insertion efficiency factor YidD [Candidatus Caenarcaniphilales bacterium]|nr:membrane protein insertion efficiency factor YidD [Candidatus Caenarcaniphilales bacterium]